MTNEEAKKFWEEWDKAISEPMDDGNFSKLAEMYEEELIKELAEVKE